MQNKNYLKKGFTLLEILLVVAAIAILAGIVIVALNPGKQLGDTRNSQRHSDTRTLIDSIYQYSIDNKGVLPVGIDEELRVLGTNTTACDTNCGAVSATYSTATPATSGTILDDTLTEIGAGTYINTKYNLNNFLEVDHLDRNLDGSYESKIVNTGAVSAFSTLAYYPNRPTNKEMPNAGTVEAVYPFGNVSTNGNVLLLHMNEASGNIIDTSVSRKALTNKGASYSTSGKFSRSLDFTDSADMLTIPGNIDIGSKWTVSTWFKYPIQETSHERVLVADSTGVGAAGTISRSVTIGCASRGCGASGTVNFGRVVTGGVVDVYARGDFSSSNEYAYAYVNGNYIGNADSGRDSSTWVKSISNKNVDSNISGRSSVSLGGAAQDAVSFSPSGMSNYYDLRFDFTARTAGSAGDRQVVVQAGTHNLGTFDGTGRTGFKDSGFNMNTLSSGWHHLTVSQDGSKMNFYMDGKKVGTVSGYTSTSNISTVGNHINGGMEFGNLDEFSIWNRDLSETEIVDLYRRGAGNINMQVRSCDDDSCVGEDFIGPDGTSTTFYEWNHNMLATTPSYNLTNVIDNQYFQYKIFINSLTTEYSPEVRNMSVNYSSQGTLGGVLTGGSGGEMTNATCLDIASSLVPNYIVGMPTDPTTGGAGMTNYAVKKTAGGRINVVACTPEQDEMINIVK